MRKEITPQEVYEILDSAVAVLTGDETLTFVGNLTDPDLLGPDEGMFELPEVWITPNDIIKTGYTFDGKIFVQAAEDGYWYSIAPLTNMRLPV